MRFPFAYLHLFWTLIGMVFKLTDYFIKFLFSTVFFIYDKYRN